MALSGVINGTFSGTAATNVKPVLEWKATQNISNNTSAVTVSLVFIKSNSYWYPYNLGGHNVAITINGNNATSSRAIDMRNTSRQVIWSRTVTVPHNADGTKSLNIGGSGSTGINLGSYNVNGSITLNTIPRSSSMSVSPTSLNFGETVKFNISRASGSFTHLINYNINGTSGNAVAKTNSTTPTWTIPLDLMKHCTTATSINVTLWLDTYNGNSKIGVKQYSVKVNIPASVTPTISLFSTVEKNTKISTLGLAANNFLQGNSQIECTSSASSQYGASIVKSTIDITGFSSINSGNTVVNLAGMTGQVGAKTAKLTVTDSRGRTAESSKEITIHAYEPPKINSFNAERKGTNIVVTKSCTYSEVGSNTISYSLTRTGGATGSVGDITHDTNTYTFGGYAVDKSYEITMEISDKLNSASGIVIVGTDKQLMHIDRDNGIGIGKYRENGILDVSGDVYIDGKLNLSNGFESVYIPSNSDLDNYNNVGFYYNPSNAEAKTIKNTPENWSFSLLVEKHAGVRQTLSIYHDEFPRTYVRNFYEGVWGKWRHLGGFYKQEEIEPASGFTKYGTGSGSSNTPLVIRMGSVVMLTGAFSNTSVINGNNTIKMGTIPKWARPDGNIIARSKNQASGGNSHWVAVGSDGTISTSRHGSSGQWTNANVGSYLTIDMMYLVENSDSY
ncbi:DUF859 family phage minor structural protein [Vagococcus elongatus]|uniref:Uncharacterized protein n=1 Tax=Vagococcus elongatus TaxID=180344 RepID=A0A430AVV4_9ENTE|nr:DUF859 family phage minor structural protein [Vagococcus elongatus]RSU12185.1 hypothetical protein CBF29_06185 [Vagococcus elongatus]